MPTLNVFVKDPQGQPVAGARVAIITKNAAIQPSTRITSGDGGANLYYHGPPFAPPLMVDIMVDAAGYAPFCTADEPIVFGGADIDYQVALRPFRLPFKPAPRAWAGQMCGSRVPGLPPVPGGASDPSLVLSWFYDRYGPNDRARIRAAWKARGYLDVLLSWPDSRVIGYTPEGVAATCRELIADGLRPCPMLCSKDMDPIDANAILFNLEPLLRLLIGLVPRVCIGWELSLWLSPIQVQQLIDAIAPRFTPAATKVYVHLQQGYFAFQQDGGVTADFWSRNVGLLTGVLHQRDLSWDKPMYQARIVDCLERFAGGWGFPSDSGFGHPFDFVALEISAQPQFDGEMSEADGDAWGRVALETPAVGDVRVQGSGNGF